IQNSQADTIHGGGAIFSNGPVFIANSTLKKNSAGLGGALLIQNSAHAQLTGSRFEDNRTLNTTSGYGGAIWVKPGTTLNAVDTLEFFGNVAPEGISLAGFGGALASYGTLRINGVSFAVNKARFGGGLYIGTLVGAPMDSARATVQETSFQSNSATRLGGALY